MAKTDIGTQSLVAGKEHALSNRVVSLIKNAANIFVANRAASRGAAIAFYSMTSIVPVLLIVIAVAGLVFGREAASGAIFAQFRGLLGAEGADLLQKTVAGGSNMPASLFASVIGVVTLILTASGVFLELEDALNAMWNTEPKKAGLSGMVRARLASLALVIGLGFLLMISLVVDAGLQGMSSVINSYLPFGAPILLAISFTLTLVLNAVLFAAIYKLLPAKPIPWRHVVFGAGVTAVLFQIGKTAIGLYLGSQGAQSSLGAAGAFLGLLFWVYYSAQIFLFGAALTRANFKTAAPNA